MALLFAGLTDIGQKRKNNQDSIYLDGQSKLFLVADGMGGHNGGDVASQIAVELIPKLLEQNTELPAQEALTRSILQANKSIIEKANSTPELKGMGTTLVSFFFKDDSLYIGNVGDSRAYLASQNKIFQLSRDHSLIQEKLNLGIYNRKQAAADPHKNILVRTVGIDSNLQVDIFKYKVCRNDIFLSSSDGLHAKVSDADIIFLINQYLPSPEEATQKDVEQLVQSLVDQANANGGNDNISVIVVLAK